MALWSQADLEAVVGRDALLRALGDGAGSIDEPGLARLQEDSDAWILGYVRGNHTYAAIVTHLAADPPAQLKRISLGYAQVLLGQRKPEFFRRDWMPMFEALRAEAVDIQTGRFRLDIGSATAPLPGNVGGVVIDSQGRTETSADLCDFEAPVWRDGGDW